MNDSPMKVLKFLFFLYISDFKSLFQNCDPLTTYNFTNMRTTLNACPANFLLCFSIHTMT
jgi:hypothetical protein